MEIGWVSMAGPEAIAFLGLDGFWCKIGLRAGALGPGRSAQPASNSLIGGLYQLFARPELPRQGLRVRSGAEGAKNPAVSCVRMTTFWDEQGAQPTERFTGLGA